MHIMAIGLHYRTTPVEIREKFTFAAHQLSAALDKLKSTKSVMECVIVGTCNRTELYVVVDRKYKDGHFVRGFLEEWFGVPRSEFQSYLYRHEDEKAVEHLFRVACGLESMIIGETQILGQIRDAFLLAQEQGTTGTLFNTLFKQAITLAKRAHSETGIGENPVSVSYAAVELGKKVFGSFAHKNVLLIGAGKMSELTAKHLHAGGVNRILVVNRTLSRAQELGEKFGGEAYGMEFLQQALMESDIVISSTGADGYVLRKEQVQAVLLARKSRPLFLVDIAVPRDLDPAIADLPNAYLYDIDDLESIVESNLAERQQDARLIEAMIAEAGTEFAAWLRTLGVTPVIQALQAKSNRIYESTLEDMLKKMPELDEREIKVIRKLTKSIVNQMMRDPILRVKELAGERRGDEAVAMFTQLFALEDILAEQKREEARMRAAEEYRETSSSSGRSAAGTFGAVGKEAVAGS